VIDAVGVICGGGWRRGAAAAALLPEYDDPGCMSTPSYEPVVKVKTECLWNTNAFRIPTANR